MKDLHGRVERLERVVVKNASGMPTHLIRFTDSSGKRICGLAYAPAKINVFGHEEAWLDADNSPIPSYFISDETLDSIMEGRLAAVETDLSNEPVELRQGIRKFLETGDWHSRHFAPAAS
jgi:hypothetical protein